jgi:hypothetical protein
LKELKLMEKQRPHQNVFKCLGDDWWHLRGLAWPKQRGADGGMWNSTTMLYTNTSTPIKEIKTNDNRKQQGKGGT